MMKSIDNHSNDDDRNINIGSEHEHTFSKIVDHIDDITIILTVNILSKWI